MSWIGSLLAGFQVILIGRIWVTPEVIQCVVTIPALSNRILYYILDHLDDSGAIVASEPMEAVAEY